MAAFSVPLLWVALAGGVAPGAVDADIVGLRSEKGQILACITTRPDRFPDCQGDANARHLALPASGLRDFRFDDLPSGDYAIALIHDENGNNKLDTALGIPREGFGFSRDPAIHFGPPSFKSAQFPVTSGTTSKSLKVRYLL